MAEKQVDFQAALQRAKEIAKQLATTGIPADSLGKRQRDDSFAPDGHDMAPRKNNFDASYGMGVPTGTELLVPAGVVGYLIGRSGESLKVIERVTGAKIFFNTDFSPSDLQRKVNITGTVQSMNSARSMLMEKVEEARNRGGLAPSEGGNSISISVPRNKIGLIIGRQASTLKDLQQRSGAKIFVPPDNATDRSSADRMVHISGDDESIQAAKLLVENIAFGGNFNRNEPSFGEARVPSANNVQIQVPDDVVGILIGRGGETIKQMQADSNCRIQIEAPNGSKDRNINISGDPDDILTAQQIIQERLAGTGAVLNMPFPTNEKDPYNQIDYSTYYQQVDPTTFDYAAYYQQQFYQQQQQQPPQQHYHQEQPSGPDGAAVGYDPNNYYYGANYAAQGSDGQMLTEEQQQQQYQLYQQYYQQYYAGASGAEAHEAPPTVPSSFHENTPAVSIKQDFPNATTAAKNTAATSAPHVTKPSPTATPAATPSKVTPASAASPPLKINSPQKNSKTETLSTKESAATNSNE